MTRSRAQSPPTTYTITDLGTFGGTESKAFAINSCGQVAGYATDAGGSKRPFFRPANTLIDLGVLSGDGTATSLNNSGYVVGSSPTLTPTDRAFIWHDDNGNNANDPGEMKQLLPVGAAGSADDINDNGKVVGWVMTAGSSGGTGGFNAFAWENNTFQFISGTPAPSSPLAHGINNAGTIVGENSDAIRGWVLRNGVFTTIGLFPTANDQGRSVAYEVSEGEHVVGTAAFNFSSTHAFVWTDANGLKDLGTLIGMTNSIAYNVAIVNSLVQVVGASYIGVDEAGPTARAFVWQDLNNDGDGNGVEDVGEMKYLWDLIPAADQANWAGLQQARSINSSGQIVGFGLKTNGETHAFLLTPPSGPPSACLPNVSVSVSPSAINEDAAGTLTYTFTRSITTGSPLTVNFSTTGTANGSDYGISHSGTVTIPANQQSATVVVDPTTDSTFEANETVILTTTAGPGYNVGTPSSATGTINNDDTTNVSVAVSPANTPEDGATNLVYTFTRNSTFGSLTVNFSVAGTAALNTDYGQTGAASFTSSTGTVTFADGSSTAAVTINPNTDAAVEPDETVSLTVTTGSGYNVGSPSAAEGTISNDDTNVSVAVSPTPVTENGAPNLVYTFTRTGVTTGALTVNFSVSGTADAADYGQTGATTFAPPTGTVIFAAGSPTATVTVDPTADSTVEPDETLTLTLAAGANYNVGSPNSATGTITNDDADVSVTVSPSSVAESGSDSLFYTFTRAGVMTDALTVNFSVAGTAIFNTDYTQSGAATFSSSAGTVTLPAGSGSATVTLVPTPDFIDEGDETVILTVTTGTGYNVGSPGSQQGTITDDDPTPTIQITDVTAPEPSSPTSFVFTVSLTNPSASQIDLNYTTATTGATTPATGGAGCTPGIDYGDAAATLSFAPGETSKQINVTVCSDSTLEPDETFFVNLSGNTNSTLPPGTRGIGTITPQVPVLWTEVAGPSCPSGTCLAAIDSVTFVRGPFRLTNEWNLTPSDRATRIILFTSNLGMTNANLASGILSVHINGSAIPLANIENVGTVTGVSGMDASYVIVKLPASLPPGSNTITVNMGSVASNVAVLSIIP
ncbi:MAG TPA: Calx-beta domain-containing protein [Pyrinomonadaceae bacterium]|nr:Calx-beta domain-containing protein [Pyrinomonadaceae bacterium]